MHAHDHDIDGVESLRPKGSRIDEVDPLAARAAAGGRWDALRPEGLAQLQRALGNAGVAAAISEEQESPVHSVVSGGGRPLEPEVRQDMEARLGHDFSDVRVHDDAAAHDSAVGVHAHAYTVGSNIVFQRDRYDPSTPSGQTTLAHELTHVVQQSNGPVDGTPAAGGIKVSDPSDRFEREAAANADRVMSAPGPFAAPVTSGVSAVQRHAEDDTVQGSFLDAPAVQRHSDDEKVQGSFVDAASLQRQGEEEEKEEVQGSFVDAPEVQREGEDEEETEG